MLLHYLVKIKMPLLPFSHYGCYKNIHQNYFISFSYCKSYALDSTGTACHVRELLWVLYLSAKQYVSSLNAHSLRVSVSQLNLLKWRHPLSFHQACGPNTHIWTSKLQNLPSNDATEGLRQKIDNVHGLRSRHGFEPRISNNIRDDWHKRLQVCIHIEGLPE